jgi:hypothetical protein
MRKMFDGLAGLTSPSAFYKYCDSHDLTLQAILSNGVATVRQTLRRMFSAMAAERAKKRHKLVLTPGFVS